MIFPRWFEQILRHATDRHILIYRLSKGRLLGAHTLLLTTIGRKSGKPRTSPLLFVRDGDDFIIVASYGGNDKAPAWYVNLQATPRVLVEAHGCVLPCIVTGEAEGDEYARLWERLVAIYPLYEWYKQRTSRVLPIVRLHPL